MYNLPSPQQHRPYLQIAGYRCDRGSPRPPHLLLWLFGQLSLVILLSHAFTLFHFEW